MNDDKKCGLECIRTNAARMCVKPEKGQCPRCKQLMEVVKAMKELGTVKRERDAAVRDCSEFPCNTCTENNPHFYSPFCEDCIKSGRSRRTNHEWRGVCPENTEVQDGD